VKTKTELTLFMIMMLGFLAAIPSAMAGRDQHTYGHKYNHFDQYDRHYRGQFHSRHQYKQQRRHKYSHKHHFDRHNFYSPQLSGHYKRKHRHDRHHYRYKQHFPQPRYIIKYNNILNDNRSNITYGFDPGNTQFMLPY
jgi:hypothetical protein